MKKYKSKIGGLFSVSMFITVAVLVYTIYNEFTFLGVIVLLLIIAFIIDLALRTYYVINNDHLFIRCGFFTTKIDLKSVRKISDSKDLISSPALSNDRLEIVYNKFDTILISPKEKTAFLSELKIANPDIEIKSKSISASP
jgi:hypothetical protein